MLGFRRIPVGVCLFAILLFALYLNCESASGQTPADAAAHSQDHPVPQAEGKAASGDRVQNQSSGTRLRGLILDPQGKSISGAEAVLTCGSSVLHATANQRGFFNFPSAPSFANCSLSVVQAEFAPYARVLRAHPSFLQIKLKLAVVRQTVSVAAKSEWNVSGDSLDSISLSRDELTRISNDSQDLATYAELFAGAPPGPSNIYVDGLPSAALPPADLIQSLAVNQDAFSAEFADGDQNRLEVTTRAPDRNLHFSAGGSSLGFGGNSPLGSNLHSGSNWISPLISGPIPRLPFTFAVKAAYSSNWSDQLIQATDVSSSESSVRSGSISDSGLFNLYYSRGKQLHGYLALSQTDSSTSNSGAGGLTLAQAATGGSFDAQEVRGTLQDAGQNWTSRAGLSFRKTHSRAQANDSLLGIDVLGYFVSGGAPLADRWMDETNWAAMLVLQSFFKRRLWEAGATVSRSDDSDDQVPNAAGQVKFPNYADYTAAQSGAPTGTWLASSRSGLAAYTSFRAAPFVQGQLWRRRDSVIQGGLRADYQSSAGVAFSPRLSAAARLHTVIFRAGAGVFVHSWQDSVYLQPLVTNLMGPSVTTGVSLAGEPAPLSTSTPALVITQVAPGLVRPRLVMAKTGVERPFGHFDPGFESTWTIGKHLLGSRRTPDAGNWLDLLESNRDLRRVDLHARLRYLWKTQSLTGNYDWTRARDDTDGPFSYPQYYDNLRADWARSTGVPVHNFSLIGNFNLPQRLSFTIAGAKNGSSPFNVITGNDFDRDGLFNDRGGLPRNSGNGPGYRDVSLYVSRHVTFGRLFDRRDSGLGADLGFQVKDLLQNRNYLQPEPVESSPLFGRPLAALPGRSIKFWINFGR